MIAKINMSLLSADNIVVSLLLYTAATRWMESIAFPSFPRELCSVLDHPGVWQMISEASGGILLPQELTSVSSVLYVLSSWVAKLDYIPICMLLNPFAVSENSMLRWAVWDHHHCYLDPYTRLLWALILIILLWCSLCWSRYIWWCPEGAMCVYFLCLGITFPLLPSVLKQPALESAEQQCWRCRPGRNMEVRRESLPSGPALSQNFLVRYPLGPASCLWLYKSKVIELFRKKIGHKCVKGKYNLKIKSCTINGAGAVKLIFREG